MSIIFFISPEFEQVVKSKKIILDGAGDKETSIPLKGIRKVIADIVADMQTAGETVPEPIAGKHYSGKFIVRIPPDVHRKLAIQAAESGVSLNRLASSKLSQ